MAGVLQQTQEVNRGPPRWHQGNLCHQGRTPEERAQQDEKECNASDHFVSEVMRAVSAKHTEVQGNQAYFVGKGLILEIWLQPHIQAAKFSGEAVIQLSEGVRITAVKPALQTHCTMTVWGMPFCSPDSPVEEMVELYGGKLQSPHGGMEKYKGGPFQGMFNEVRKYKVDMTPQVQPMGLTIYWMTPG